MKKSIAILMLLNGFLFVTACNTNDEAADATKNDIIVVDTGVGTTDSDTIVGPVTGETLTREVNSGNVSNGNVESNAPPPPPVAKSVDPAPAKAEPKVPTSADRPRPNIPPPPGRQGPPPPPLGPPGR